MIPTHAPPRLRPWLSGIVAAASLTYVLVGTSCTAVDSYVYLGHSDASAGFGSPDASTPTDPPDGSSALMCIGTTCPDGFATCSDGTKPAYKCGADLKHDPNHCGECGNRCLHYETIHVTSRCVEGSCELECFNPYNPDRPTAWTNCNGKIDDGCESDTQSDPKNCGACGNACAPGEPCEWGKCGCAPHEIICNGRCVDPMSDDGNCGGCGNECPGDGACESDGTWHYGCVGGQCGQPKCEWMRLDCNGDLGDPECKTDGCESGGVLTDPNNCGKCGNKCDLAAGEQCVNEGSGPECAVPCVRFNKTECLGQCYDLRNDPRACGSCFNPCPEAGPNQESACRKGVCELDCLHGWADCNGDPSDGCETNIAAHPANCGACGNECNIAAGQPCVGGKCLMTECADGGIVQ